GGASQGSGGTEGGEASGGSTPESGGSSGSGGKGCTRCDGGISVDGKITGLEAVENPANVLSYYVSWKTDVATATTLAVDCGEDYVHDFDKDSSTKEHEVFVLGLFAGAKCTLIASSGPGTSTASIDIEVNKPSTLPDFTVAVAAGKDTEPGFTLLNLSNESPPQQPGVAAII